jgi:hypothetical protein
MLPKTEKKEKQREAADCQETHPQERIHSMAHRIDNHIHGALVGMQSVFRGIARIVYPFPRIAHVGVERDEANQPAMLVFDAHAVWDGAALL